MPLTRISLIEPAAQQISVADTPIVDMVIVFAGISLVGLVAVAHSTGNYSQYRLESFANHTQSFQQT